MPGPSNRSWLDARCLGRATKVDRTSNAWAKQQKLVRCPTLGPSNKSWSDTQRLGRAAEVGQTPNA
ncbi:unnamed protein product [Camellia sinensis]